MELGLDGRVALVTGAARGFGAAIARALAREGCRVVLADLDAAGAQAQAASIDRQATALAMDVGDAARVREGVARVLAAHGAIDVLVNNAGEIASGPFDATDAASWERMRRVNLDGLFHCVQAVAPAMRARGRGAIVNIASVSAERGGGAVGNVWYGATKAAVVAATQGLARDLGPHGVRVNAIAPGLAKTALTEPHLDAAIEARLLARFPMKRFARPQDVAEAAVFLASDAAAFVNGAVLAVDGGFLAT